MAKLVRKTLVITLLLPTLAIADANPYQDGNTAGGLFTRTAIALRHLFDNLLSIPMAIGVFFVIGGLITIATANKTQLSPRYGMAGVISGLLLVNPVSCADMTSQEFFERGSQATQIIDNPDGYINPNDE